jgi:hypothetical protein
MCEQVANNHYINTNGAIGGLASGSNIDILLSNLI